jgi:quercetin dioxygenase-like cupin family protein
MSDSIDMQQTRGFAVGDVSIRPFSGESLTITRVDAPGGSAAPPHSHPHEQVAIVQSGHMRITIDGKPVDVRTGELVHLPSGVEHGVEFVEDTVLWDVFTPVREDFMEMVKGEKS